MPLNNSQYNEIMREYDRKQSAREAEISRRRKDVFSAEPELRDIEEDLRKAHISKVRSELAGENVSPITDRINALEERRARLFSVLPFPGDYLDVPYECPDCKDKGIVDGKRCHCFTKSANELLFKNSNMDLKLRQGLDSFRLDIYDDTEQDPAGRTSLDYAKALLSDGKHLLSSLPDSTSFYIFGNTGTGKTHFACCLATEVINLGYSAVFIKSSDFIDLCYQRLEDKEGDRTAMYDSLFECDLLVLDDWGTAFSTKNNSNLFLNLIDTRLTSGLSTAITSNLSLVELKAFCDDRIFSRIAGSYKAYHFFGLDQRTKRR